MRNSVSLIGDAGEIPGQFHILIQLLDFRAADRAPGLSVLCQTQNSGIFKNLENSIGLWHLRIKQFLKTPHVILFIGCWLLNI